MSFRKEPSRFEVHASRKSAENTKLARAVYKLNAWSSYDSFQAHVWALRLINAAPANGEEVAVALINYEWMVPAARAEYQSNSRKCQERSDKIFEVYRQWKEVGGFL